MYVTCLCYSHINVYGSNTDIVMKLSSTDTKARRSAKSELKAKLLEEFKKSKDISSSDLKGFKPLFANITKAFGS